MFEAIAPVSLLTEKIIDDAMALLNQQNIRQN
jgi:hypothetical protein